MNRILAVEDSATQAERLRVCIADAGYEVVMAGDGQEALERLREESFDLVISDIVMPRMDGYELCSQAKAEQPELPVVLLTSLTDPTEIVRGLEAGADNFLRKPYEPEQLLRRLRTILYHQEMRAGGHAHMGLEVMLRNKRFLITAERQQILDLLVSSFEELVDVNEQLHQREGALHAAKASLLQQLEATERERQRLDTVLHAVPHSIAIVDGLGVITEVSDHLLSVLGCERDRVVGRRPSDTGILLTASGAEIPAAERPLERVLSGEHDLIEVGAGFDIHMDTAEGPMPVIIRASPVRDRTGTVVAGVASVQEIGGLSAHDLLTRLPNHTIFVDRVSRAVTLSAKDGLKYGVLAVALDRFARLRESLSPAAVDEVITRLAAKLRSVVETVDHGRPGHASGAYFADDMFGVIIPQLMDETDGVRLAQDLVDALSGRHEVGGVAVDLTATVAAVFDDRSTTDPIELVTAAVGAARRASTRGGGIVEIVDPTIGERAGDALRREVELRDAIEGGQLEVHYQPIVAVCDGAPVGVEALVRWRHPERGLVPPMDFIPLAEESGLIIPLGWWVLEQACGQAVRWRDELPGGQDMFVSVNLAASQLNLPQVAEHVAAILATTGLDPRALRLEVTETGVVTDADSAAARLHELHDLGVGLAIDDFGTGYSSLLHLRRFPVDTLKIDRAFIANMTSMLDDATIVSASVQLAHALGLDVVAEGVENAQQLQALQTLGAELAQGYHWSRPLPSAELATWWTRQASAQAHADESPAWDQQPACRQR